MWKAVKYIIIFFAIQTFVSVLALILGKDKETSLLIGLLLSDILFITYILLNRETRPRPASFTVKPWTILLPCIFVWMAYLLPEFRIIETLDLPDTVFEDIDTESFFSVLGVLSIGVFGPIAEELLFRGVVLGSLLQWDRIKGRPWLAIILSAALFGLAHMNPAQLPAALSMGLFFGWLFYRTGSLIPGIVLHVFNNSLPCIAGMISAEETGPETMADYFGSPWIEDISIALSLIVCIEFLVVVVRMVNRHYPPMESFRLAQNESDAGDSEGVADM